MHTSEVMQTNLALVKQTVCTHHIGFKKHYHRQTLTSNASQPQHFQLSRFSNMCFSTF